MAASSYWSARLSPASACPKNERKQTTHGHPEHPASPDLDVLRTLLTGTIRSRLNSLPQTSFPALRLAVDIPAGLSTSRDRAAASLEQGRRQTSASRQTFVARGLTFGGADSERQQSCDPLVPKSECLTTTTWEGGSNTSPSTLPTIPKPSDLPDDGMSACPWPTKAWGGLPAACSVIGPITGSNVTAQRLEGQQDKTRTNVLAYGQEFAMGDGQGNVGRITALVLKNNQMVWEHVRSCPRDGVVSLAWVRTAKALAQAALLSAELCESQHAVSDHFRKEISFGPATVEHLANVGLHVVKGPMPSNVIPLRGRATIDTEIA